MSDDPRTLVRDTHTQLFDFVQSQFDDIMSTLRATELDLVKRCQGLHEGIASHCNQQHQKLANGTDPEFIRSLDGQGEELVRIVQTRFAEMTRDLKQCHGGACRIVNQRASEQVFQMSKKG